MKRVTFLSNSVFPGFLYAVLLVLISMSNASTSQPSGLELYVSPDQSFKLYKPPGWQVMVQTPGNVKTIQVVDPVTGAAAALSIMNATDPNSDSVAWAAEMVKVTRNLLPHTEVIEAKSSRDRKRTVVELSGQDAEGNGTVARFYYSISYPQASVMGYEVPAADQVRLRPILTKILTNITLTRQPEQRAETASRATQQVYLPLSRQQLADGTGSIEMPAGWNLLGEQGQAFCLSPDSTKGFAFSISNFWATSQIPYFNVPNMPGMLHHAYTQPISAIGLVLQHLDAGSIRVIESWSDPQRAAAAAVQLNRQMESETAFLEYVNAEGVHTRGYFDAMTFAPLSSGQWSVLYWAIWAPAPEFDSYAPTLAKMAASYKVNEAWAADMIHQGMQKLAAQINRTTNAVDQAANEIRESNYSTFQEAQRSDDYITAKRESAILGQQEWVAEDGEVFFSDDWGLSREGEPLLKGKPWTNPHYIGDHPGLDEQLTPVDSTREVFEGVHGTHW